VKPDPEVIGTSVDLKGLSVCFRLLIRYSDDFLIKLARRSVEARLFGEVGPSHQGFLVLSALVFTFVFPLLQLNAESRKLLWAVRNSLTKEPKGLSVINMIKLCLWIQWTCVAR
jgi:hypothetical protein